MRLLLFISTVGGGVAKSKRALNHKDTKAQRKLFLSAGRSPEKTLCLRVFVVPFFSVAFARPSKAGIPGSQWIPAVKVVAKSESTPVELLCHHNHPYSYRPKQSAKIATIATSWDKISTEPLGRSCICGYQQPNLPGLKASRPKQYAEESKVAIMTK